MKIYSASLVLIYSIIMLVSSTGFDNDMLIKIPTADNSSNFNVSNSSRATLLKLNGLARVDGLHLVYNTEEEK